MKYINILVFIGLLITSNLSAKTYEDGEDKKTSRWETLRKTSNSTIKNKYDKLKSSRVIQFDGNETKSAYIMMINADNTKNLLSWQMKYSEDFVIFISLETKLGRRYLIYTPGNKDGYMQYGLGYASISGTWQRYSRNLEEDLRYFDNRNTILKINSFVIRGSGSIDNIKIMKELNHKVEKSDDKDRSDDEFSKELESKPPKVKKKPKKVKKKPVKSQKKPLIVKPKSPKIKKKPLKVRNRIKTNTTPIITIEGENPLFLDVGETYVEPGVSADDKEDGEVIVTSSENIDKHQEGQYAVIYVAIDSVGNSAIDRRSVIIGEGSDESDTQEEAKEESSDESNKSSSKSKSKEEESDEQFILEERELEIAEWERELQFREKEISEREKNLVK